jgi:hypothetical protein
MNYWLSPSLDAPPAETLLLVIDSISFRLLSQYDIVNLFTVFTDVFVPFGLMIPLNRSKYTGELKPPQY